MSSAPVIPLRVPAPVTGTVQLGKPWYLSKKVWVSIIGAIAVTASAYFGKADTTAQVLDKIQRTAGLILIAAPLVLSIAHVDGKERELVLGILQMAKTIETPDSDPAPAATPIAPIPSGSTATASQPVPGLDRPSEP